MFRSKALARLKETAAPGKALEYVHTLAKQVFGSVDFEPTDTVNITGGAPYIHVVPHKIPTLAQLTYFGKLLHTPGINSVRVQNVAPDLDHGPTSIKVEFYTRIR